MQIALSTNLFLQLCFALLAAAAPVTDPTIGAAGHGNTWQYGTGGGILGFIVLVLDIIVFSALNPNIIGSLVELHTNHLSAFSGSFEV